MRLLHTSDWHLGRALYGRKREAEFSRFLQWLLETMREEKVDILLVSGDIFDTTTPSNWAQTLYYRFLTEAVNTGCRHIVITAGNHDSATFLEAPAGILESMNIHVVGATDGDVTREVISIDDRDGSVGCIICAVPYLRERDIRSSNPGESIEEKSLKLVEAIEHHYHNVVQCALDYRKDSGPGVPIIAMGHLFAAGGKSVKGDGVRDLYVGSLAHVPASIFPPEIDYLALGHLHRNQLVAQQESMRYSGSPLPMSFEEARREKQVIIIDVDQHAKTIRELAVPCFQRLQCISGDLQELHRQIEDLKQEESSIWLEIQYTGTEIATSLQDDLRKATGASKIEILRIINSRIIESYLSSQEIEESLEQLSVEEVFERCLQQNHIGHDDHKELKFRFNRALDSLQQQEAE